MAPGCRRQRKAHLFTRTLELSKSTWMHATILLHLHHITDHASVTFIFDSLWTHWLQNLINDSVICHPVASLSPLDHSSLLEGPITCAIGRTCSSVTKFCLTDHMSKPQDVSPFSLADITRDKLKKRNKRNREFLKWSLAPGGRKKSECVSVRKRGPEKNTWVHLFQCLFFPRLNCTVSSFFAFSASGDLIYLLGLFYQSVDL